MTDELFNFIKSQIESNINTKSTIETIKSKFGLTNSQASSAVKNIRKKLKVYTPEEKDIIINNEKKTKFFKFNNTFENLDRNSYLDEVVHQKNKKRKKLSYDK